MNTIQVAIPAEALEQLLEAGMPPIMRFYDGSTLLGQCDANQVGPFRYRGVWQIVKRCGVDAAAMVIPEGEARTDVNPRVELRAGDSLDLTFELTPV